ncbi:CIR protein, partial [Plasmodium chabaudi adami]
MNHEILCGLLIEADDYFNGKDVDAQRINDEPTIKGYCSNDGCKTNEARINALAAYIIMLLKKSIKDDEYNDYDECFLMWLSDKLFKIHRKSKDKNTKITLNQAYGKYLKKHKIILNYWDLFDNIKGLKNADLKYMSEFYKLLNKICITITDYNDNGAESMNIIMNSTECSNQYMMLYNWFSECKSHLHLLNKLKYIYDQFRKPAMKEIREKKLPIPLQTLTTITGVEMRSSKVFKSYNFSNTKCKFPPPKKKIVSSKKAKPPGPQESSQASGSENQGNMDSSTERVQKNGSDISKGTDAGTGDPGSVPGGGKDNKAGDIGSGTEGTSGDTRRPNSENEKKS